MRPVTSRSWEMVPAAEVSPATRTVCTESRTITAGFSTRTAPSISSQSLEGSTSRLSERTPSLRARAATWLAASSPAT